MRITGIRNLITGIRHFQHDGTPVSLTLATASGCGILYRCSLRVRVLATTDNCSSGAMKINKQVELRNICIFLLILVSAREELGSIPWTRLGFFLVFFCVFFFFFYR